MVNRRLVLFSMGTLAVATILGCKEQSAHAVKHQPVAIADGDECHVCGMIINNFPGPKGQAYVQGADTPLKFCSTRDLFAFLTQPEAQSVTREVYVHDMAVGDWDKPDDNAYTNGREAIYVICHPLRGAMGAALASFKDRHAAIQFAEQHGGKLIVFADVDVALISRLNDAC